MTDFDRNAYIRDWMKRKYPRQMAGILTLPDFTPTDVTKINRFDGRHGDWPAIRATLSCLWIGCDCGGTLTIEVNESDLPHGPWNLRKQHIIRECPKRLAARRSRKAATTQRWRSRNPEVARERNRQQVAAHRARKRAEAGA